MYQTFIFCHTTMRWLVLISLLLAIFKSARGFVSQSPFTKTDNAIRHWTATIAHIQLLLGMVLYFQSPIVKYFWSHIKEAAHHKEMLFFGCVHMLLMLISVVLITLGSAFSKREETDRAKFRTMLSWFSIALVLILLAIPWPFSPLSARPYFR